MRLARLYRQLFSAVSTATIARIGAFFRLYRQPKDAAGSAVSTLFSAVSTATIARIGAFFSFFRDLQDQHTFVPLQAQNFSEIALQEETEFIYKQRFCRCRGCVAELHRETTDYYTTSFRDFRKIPSCDLFFSPKRYYLWVCVSSFGGCVCEM